MVKELIKKLFMKFKLILLLILPLLSCEAQTVIPAIPATHNQFNPATLFPDLWIDAVHGAYTSTIDNNGTRANGNIIDGATANTGQTITIGGTLGQQPIYNGEGWYFNPVAPAQISIVTTTDFNYLHNGSDFEIYLWYYHSTQTGNGTRGLIYTNGYSSTARGLLLTYDNTGSIDRLNLKICNGSIAVININMDGVLDHDALNKIRILKSGNTVTVFVDGVQVGTQTNTGWSVSDAAGNLVVFGGSNPGLHLWLYDLVIFDKTLAASEVVSMNARTFETITPTDINVYAFTGDSNCEGYGVNASIASDLTGNVERAYSGTFSTNSTISNTWLGKLLLGTNQNLSTENVATQHGIEMRFCKAMGSTTTKDLFIVKYGRGSTSLLNDWSTATTVQTQFKNGLQVAYSNLKHIYRRNPVLRGFIWVGGANDAAIGGQTISWTRSGTTATITQTNHARLTGQKIPVYGSTDTNAIPLATYVCTRIDANTFTIPVVNTGATSGTLDYSGGLNFKTLFYTYVNDVIDYVEGTIGVPVTKLRIYVLETRTPGTFNAVSLSDVIAGQQAVGTSYLIDNPSRSGNVLGSSSQPTNMSYISMADGTHYGTTGLDDLGKITYVYFKPFINE